jgi:hypothetical protein
MGIYVSTVCQQYARCTESCHEIVHYWFFSIFTAIFLFCMSSLFRKNFIFSPRISQKAYAFGSILITITLKIKTNTFANATYDYGAHCGVNNCPNTKLPISSSPTEDSIRLLCGVLVAICIVGIVNTIVFLDDLEMTPDESKDCRKSDEQTSKFSKICNSYLKTCPGSLDFHFLILAGSKFNDELKNMFELSKRLDIYLLLPMSIFTGFELTYLWNEINKVF